MAVFDWQDNEKSVQTYSNNDSTVYETNLDYVTVKMDTWNIWLSWNAISFLLLHILMQKVNQEKIVYIMRSAAGIPSHFTFMI